MVQNTVAMLEKNGVLVKLIMRSSRGLDMNLVTKAKAFCAGVYNPLAYIAMRRWLRTYRPDLVHAHNLYPLFSPSVLVACRRERTPIILTVHNHGITCPNWHHLRQGVICEKCLYGKEYWCAITNCTGSLWKSIGYALRSSVARRLRLFQENVDVVISTTNFAKSRLIELGFEADRVTVIPNMAAFSDSPASTSPRKYAAFVGRISPEKGIDTLLAAADLTDIPLHMTGSHEQMPNVARTIPHNVRLRGLLDPAAVRRLYEGARFVVVPSKCYEMCPLVIAEAMSHGLPVIASRIGGLPELVEEGVTGMLFEPNDAKDLASRMQLLWNNHSLCQKLGQAGRRKALQEFSEDAYYQRLMSVYQRAIKMNKPYESSAKGVSIEE